jgi:hypothetical protein
VVAMLLAMLLLGLSFAVPVFQVGQASNGGMNAQAVLTISAAVVGLTQLIKFSKVVPDSYGLYVSVGLAALGVAVWGVSQPVVYRTEAFDYFAGWIAVATSASGVFGIARAVTPAEPTKGRRPPAPPFEQPTNKVD